QRAEGVALRAALVERARLRERVLAVEMDERFDLAVESFDAVETSAGIILGRNGAAGDFRCGLGCGQRCQPVVGHSSAPARSPRRFHRLDRRSRGVLAARAPTCSLAVKPQEVIPGQTESADRWLACEANMRPVPVVAMEPSGQRGISLL